MHKNSRASNQAKGKNLAEIILPNLDCHNNSKYSHSTNESSLDSP